MFNLMQFISINLSPNKSSKPVRLAKVEAKSSFEEFCERICPYVLVVSLIILVVLLLFAFLKYGRLWFSTPQNISEHMNEVVLFYGGLYGFL